MLLLETINLDSPYFKHERFRNVSEGETDKYCNNLLGTGLT